MATTVPRKGALVVVDMQNDYCNARGVYPRHGLNCFDMNSVVPATVAAVTTCNTRTIPVIYLRMAWNTDAHGFPIDAGLIIERSRPFIRTEGLRRGTWGAEVLAEMPPPDYVVEKTRYSGFHNTALDALLRGLDIDTIFLAGVITNMCVEATARDAFHTATFASWCCPTAFRASAANCTTRAWRLCRYSAAWRRRAICSAEANSSTASVETCCANARRCRCRGKTRRL